MRSYLEEDFNFFDGLEHNIEESIQVKVKKKLKSHFKSLDEEYEEPTSFQLTILHPYLSHLQLPVEDNYNKSLFGFADTQFAISTAFLYDTIPFMKTMERMTNPYFQDTEFASIMKAKHVIGGSDSDRDDVNNLLNQSDPIQQSDPIESLLSEQPDLNFEENQSDPIESLFSEGNQSDPIESLFSQPSLNLVEGQSNSDPIGSLLSQSSMDPI